MGESLGNKQFLTKMDLNKLRNGVCPKCKGEATHVYPNSRLYVCENCGLFKVQQLTGDSNGNQSEQKLS